MRISDLEARQSRTMHRAKSAGIVAIGLFGAAAIFTHLAGAGPTPTVTELSIPSALIDSLKGIDPTPVVFKLFGISGFLLCLGTSLLNHRVSTLLAGIWIGLIFTTVAPMLHKMATPRTAITIDCVRSNTCPLNYRTAVPRDSVADHFLQAQVSAVDGDRRSLANHLQAIRKAGALPDLRNEHAGVIAAIIVAAGEQPQAADAAVIAATKKKYLQMYVGRNVSIALSALSALIAAALGGVCLGMAYSIRRARSIVGPSPANRAITSEPMEMDLELNEAILHRHSKIEPEN